MDLIQAAATAALVLQESQSEVTKPPMPYYVTVQEFSGAAHIRLQMTSFDRVEAWAAYTGEPYRYHEADSEGKNGETFRVGFGNVSFHLDDPDHGITHIDVYHNEKLPDTNPDQGTLDG